LRFWKVKIIQKTETGHQKPFQLIGPEDVVAGIGSDQPTPPSREEVELSIPTELTETTAELPDTFMSKVRLQLQTRRRLVQAVVIAGISLAAISATLHTVKSTNASESRHSYEYYLNNRDSFNDEVPYKEFLDMKIQAIVLFREQFSEGFTDESVSDDDLSNARHVVYKSLYASYSEKHKAHIIGMAMDDAQSQLGLRLSLLD